MTTEPLTRLVRNLSRTLAASDLNTLADADLLIRFRQTRDPAAFEAIVLRHGPRVLAACRGVLHTEADIEDAFQATFVVLMRNPRAVRQPTALGSWLFGVAHRVALQARAARRRRERIEARAQLQPPDAPDLSWQEACAILHEELDRLPDTYRLPLLLCYLEGRSRDEAAARLGRSLGAVKKALETGRDLLRKRLVRRGVTLSAGLLAAVAQSADGCPATGLASPLVDGAIRPGATALARAVHVGLRLRLAGVGLAATVLAVGVALGFAGGPKPEPPAGKEMPAKPVAKKEAPVEDGPKGEKIAFSGRVVDPEGKGVKGAKVYLLSSDNVFEELRPSWSQRATTDEDGRFRFDEPPPIKPEIWAAIRPQLVAIADGYGMGMVPAATMGTTTAEVRLPVDLPIKGRILNLEGKPVAGTRVRVTEVMAAETDDLATWLKKSEVEGWDELTRITGSDFKRKLEGRRSPLPGIAGATTGPNGTFALTGVGRERVATLAVEGDGIATARITVLTQTGKSGVFPPSRRMRGEAGFQYYRPPFDYVASPDQPFEGRVTDQETGAPIAGVVVSQWWSETKTNEDGRYRLTGLRPGPTSLNFTVDRDLPYHTRSVPGGAKDSIQTARVDAKLLRAPWVRGRLIDERTKKPIAGARVSYKPDRQNKHASDYFDQGRSVDVEVRTGPDGRFRLAGVPGKGWLFVNRDLHGLSAAERPVQGDTDVKDPPVEVQTSDQSGAGTSPRMYQALVAVDIDLKAAKEYAVTLDAGATVPVTLTDPDGKPLTGVIAMGTEKIYYQWSKPFADAKVQLAAFNPDRPRALFFCHPDRDLGVMLRPKKGDAGPWAIKMLPTATVTGRLVLSDGKPYPNVSLSLSFKYPGQSGPAWPPRDLKEARTKTDADGHFKFTKIIGDVDYDFWYPVFNDKYNTTTTIRFTAKPGETKDLGTIKAAPPGK